MNPTSQQEQWFIVRQLLLLTQKEVRHLSQTTERIKANAPDLQWVKSLEDDVAMSEMLDAFVSRFSRLQDTLGDKLLPALLRVTLEPTGSQLDNLFRAEKIGWITSSETWIEIRALRNRLIHEHMDSPETLLEALLSALDHVALLVETEQRFAQYVDKF